MKKIPNNVQEGAMGNLWQKVKSNFSDSYRMGVFLGNAIFRP